MEAYMPSSLGGKLIYVGRQWVSEWDKEFHNSATSI